jgi:hypothetical protein
MLKKGHLENCYKQYCNPKKKWFHWFKSKIKKRKDMTGKKVRLVRAKNECRGFYLQTSSNSYIGSDREFIVAEKRELSSGVVDGAWWIKDLCGVNYGWAYEWEMEEVASSKVVLEQKMEKLKTEMEEVQSKIDFLNETGNELLDEEEFKVYSTLKLFQNDKLTDVEKSKLIAKLIRCK